MTDEASLPTPSKIVRVTTSAALIAQLLLSAAAVAQPHATSSFAFTHATVIDGTGAAAQVDQTVVVSDGRIMAVGPFAETAVPKETLTIDATGRFLIPGLWDSHVHTRFEGIDHLRLLISHGITGARNMSGPSEHLAELRRWREEIDAGSRIGPRLLTAGPLLDGPGARRSTTSVIVSSPDEGREAVRRSKAEGADFVKVYDLLSRESYFAIAEEARRVRLPFVGHVPYAVRADEAAAAGQLSIEHPPSMLFASATREAEIMAILRDWRPTVGGPPRPPAVNSIVIDSFSVAKVKALAEILKNNGTYVVPTLAVSRRVVTPERLRYVPPAYGAALSATRGGRFDDGGGTWGGWQEKTYLAVRELHDAGVTILAGTDGIMSFQVPGFSLHDELSLLVEAGLSEMDALLAATRNPADAFGMTDLGTIEPGKQADLVLLDASPLESIHNTLQIRAVVAAGRLFDRGALDAMLADIEQKARDWDGAPTP